MTSFRYARLFNQSGKAVVLENCHNSNPYTPVRAAGDRVECPMNLFRTRHDTPPSTSFLVNLRIRYYIYIYTP